MSISNQDRLSYKWVVVLVVIFGSFMSILDQTVVNNTLPHLQEAFSVDLSSLQWVVTAYTLTQGVVTPTTAFFANRLGTKRFYIISLFLFTVGSALCGLAWNLPSLVIFRIFQAIGGATLFPLSITMLFAEFPPHQRGLASGILGVSALSAPALGPTLGGLIVTYADWPLIFFINVPLGIIGIMLAIFLLRNRPSEGRLSFDLPGFILVAGGLAAVLYGLSEASITSWTSSEVLISLIGGVILLTLFSVVELLIVRRGKQPLLDLRLFANGSYLTSNIANALISFSFFGGIILLPLYTQDLRGLSAFQSGLLTIPMALTSVFAALIAGRIIDRTGPHIVLFPGLVLMGFSSWALAQITSTTDYTWVVIILAIRGLGLGCLLQPLTVSALSSIRVPQLAQASSLNSVIRFVFTSLGVAVLATTVQSRATTHITDLIAQVKPTSAAAVAQIKLQGLGLAVQDAFWLTVFPIALTVIVICFLRVKKHNPQETVPLVEQEALDEALDIANF